MQLTRTPRNAGIALVITLSMLVLLSAITIAFLSSATSERTSSTNYQNMFEARQAADSALNLVMSQIRDATTSGGEDIEAATWASQPGAIRVFRSSPETSQVYKLYSSDLMVQSESDYKPEEEYPEGFLDSNERPINEDFVDLNEPTVRRASTSTESSPKYEPAFPIIDPYPKYPYRQGTTNSSTGEHSGSFDTNTQPSTTTSAVKGFFCKDVEDPYRDDEYGQKMRLLPLPVRWIYILRDGTYAPVTREGKINGATKENPPVSRIAFWTDDETSKLNINTASEGTFWDTPTAATVQESGNADANTGQGATSPAASANLSIAQPTKGEFQRYPGHPATTCLSPAIRWLFPGYNPSINPDGDLEFKEMIYRMAPRIANGIGTTQGASKVLFNRAGDTIKLDHRPLYPTLDEYFFRPDRTGVNVARRMNSSDVTNEVPLPTFDPSAVDRLRFFLTPHSRSPDLTLFGTPRVSVWPIHGDPLKRTAFDDTFAFTSRVRAGTTNRDFFFQRRDPNSITADYDGIPRNQQVIQYLRNMTKLRVPWLPGSLESKFDAPNRDQIITNIFDYIRCVNLVDTSTASQKTGGPRTYVGFTPFFWPQNGAGEAMLESAMPRLNSGQVVPIRVQDTQGFGRFVTPSEVGVLFYETTRLVNGQTLPADKKAMRVVLLIEMFTPSAGYAGLRENYGIQVLVDKDFRWNFGSEAGVDHLNNLEFGFPKNAFSRVTVDAYSAPVGRMFMPFRGFHNQFLYDPQWNPITDPIRPWTLAPKRFPIQHPYVPGPNDHLTVYPFVSNTIVVPKDFQKFGFAGGEIRIRTYPPNTGPEANTDPAAPPPPGAIQTVHVNFASVDSDKLLFPRGGTVDFEARLTRGLNGDRRNLDANSNSSGYRWIVNGDVIRSMEVGGPTRGDQRLVANLRVVPPHFFSARGLTAYNSTTDRVHGFRMSRGGYTDAGGDSSITIKDGRLTAGVSYRGERWPKIPNDVPYAYMSMPPGRPLGDFDRGMSKNVGGALINKPDEGTMNWDPGRSDGLKMPYWLGFSGYDELRAFHFAPNRIMSSPIMFGSLPRASSAAAGGGRPWETLLFRPSAASGIMGHLGAAPPADHYLLDLFQMPVVEPYAISEPFSSSGKVNMNYMAAPFSYWKPTGSGGSTVNDSYLIRRTAMHGIFRSVKLLAIGNTQLQVAGHRDNPLGESSQVRFRLDEERILNDMHVRLVNKNEGLFRSATEICEFDLHGLGKPITAPFWQQHNIVGDNFRERPYSHIYPRLTTKSNVYTVHVRAQAIKKGRDSVPDEWDKGQDTVSGEYRGSTTIERYIDPNDEALEGYNELTNNRSLEPFYRFRVVQSRQY